MSMPAVPDATFTTGILSSATMPLNVQRPSMSAEEALTLSWYQKWKLHRRIPWKLVFHIVSTICVTLQILLTCALDIPYRREMRTTYNELFLNTSDSVHYVYEVQDFDDVVFDCIDTYFNISDVAVERFDYDDDNNPSMTLRVTSYEDTSNFWDESRENYNLDTKTEKYTLTPSDPYGPFTNFTTFSDWRDFLNSLVKMELNFVLLSQDVELNVPLFYRWNLQIFFFFQHGRIETQLEAYYEIDKAANEWTVLFLNRFLWLDALIVAISLISIALSIKSVAKTFKSIQRLKSSEKYNDSHIKRRVINWQALPLSKKIKLLNAWFVLSICGNVVLSVGYLLNILDKVGILISESETVTKMLIGVGVALTWMNLLRYIETFRSYYVLIIALKRGIPNVLRLVLSAVPLIIGYTLFGMILFSETSIRFASFDHSLAALFSSINSDSLYDIYLPLADEYSAIITRLYQYTLVPLFAYAIITIFFAIISEAYLASKNHNEAEADDWGATETFFRPLQGQSDITMDEKTWQDVYSQYNADYDDDNIANEDIDSETEIPLMSQVHESNTKKQSNSNEIQAMLQETRQNMARMEKTLKQLEALLQ